MTKKNSEGKTQGCHLSKLVHAINKRFPIHIDLDQGSPLNNVKSAKLSNELGIITRTYLPCPRSIKKLDWNVHIKPAFDRLGVRKYSQYL